MRPCPRWIYACWSYTCEPQHPRAVMRHRVTTLFTVNHSNPKLIHSVHGVVSFGYDSDTMPHRAEWCAATKYGVSSFKKNRQNDTRLRAPVFALHVVSRAKEKRMRRPTGAHITRSEIDDCDLALRCARSVRDAAFEPARSQHVQVRTAPTELFRGDRKRHAINQENGGDIGTAVILVGGSDLIAVLRDEIVVIGDEQKEVLRIGRSSAGTIVMLPIFPTDCCRRWAPLRNPNLFS